MQEALVEAGRIVSPTVDVGFLSGGGVRKNLQSLISQKMKNLWCQSSKIRSLPWEFMRNSATLGLKLWTHCCSTVVVVSVPSTNWSPPQSALSPCHQGWYSLHSALYQHGQASDKNFERNERSRDIDSGLSSTQTVPRKHQAQRDRPVLQLNEQVLKNVFMLLPICFKLL